MQQNQEILNQMKKEEEELKKRREVISQLNNSDNAVENWVKLNKKINKSIEIQGLKTVNYSDCKKNLVKTNGEKNGK